MKVRMCFVSNSSSCSNVVFIPMGFEPDWKKYETFIEDEGTSIDNCKEAFLKLMRKGEIWQDDFYSELNVLEKVFEDEDLIVAKVDTGPDAGQMVLANKDKIVRILAREH